jgi:hypothetical protein
VAIFLALIFAVQQLPVESTAGLQRLAWAFYVVGLVWIGWTGWRSVERGWRLRSPVVFAERSSVFDALADLLLGLVMLAAVARGGDSRLLAAGLDRMVSTLLTISILSTVLWLINRVRLYHPQRPAAAPVEQGLRWIRILLAAGLIALAVSAEASGF